MEKTEGTERDQLEGTKQTKTNEVSGGGRFDILFHRAVARDCVVASFVSVLSVPSLFSVCSVASDVHIAYTSDLT